MLRLRLIPVLIATFILVTPVVAIEISDFMVNEEDYPGQYDQDMLDVAYNQSGNYAVAWRDFRGEDAAAYLQLYTADGQTTGSNIRVDGMYSGQSYATVGVDMNDAGQVVIAWWSSNGSVYLARYTPDGTLSGEKLIVSNEGAYGFNPSVTMNDAGHGIVFFSTIPDGDNKLRMMGQYFDFDNGLVGDNFRAGLGHRIDNDHSPTTVMTNDDEICCSWVGYDDEDYYAKVLFSRMEYPQGPTAPEVVIDVSHAVPGDYRYETRYPLLAVSPAGRICVAWTGVTWDEISSNSYSYGGDTTFTWTAELDGTVIQGQTAVITGSQAIGALNGDLVEFGGGFLLFQTVWETGFQVCQLTADGSPLGEPLEVIPEQPEYVRRGMGVAPQGTTGYTATWQAWVSSASADIFTQSFDTTGSPLLSAALVHDDTGAVQHFPVVVYDASGASIVVWIDYRESPNGDIYGQRFTASGNALGPNFKISQGEPGLGDCSQVEISSSNNGRTVVVWVNRVGYGYRSIVGRILDSEYFVPTGDQFVVCSGETSLKYYWPDVGVAQDGSFAVVYRDRDDNDICNAFLQRYGADGLPVGSRQKINDSQGYEIGMGLDGLKFDFSPRIAMRPDGSSAVAWIEIKDNNWPWDCHYVVGQRYDASGVALGSNFLVSDDMAGVAGTSNEEIPPDIAVDANGNIVFAWTGGNNSEYYGLWARTYNAWGNPLGPQFRYMTSHIYNYHSSARVTCGAAGEFVGVWYNAGEEDEDVFAQRFSVDGELLGAPIQVSRDFSGAPQSYPTAACHDGSLVFAWEDQRVGNLNDDIFARYSSYSTFAVPCGDIDGDHYGPDISDLIYLVSYMFQEGPAPAYISACDTDGNGSGPDIADLVFLAEYMFSGGQALQCR